MSFFLYCQNNSGGVFHHDEVSGIGEYVIVEEDSADEANLKAELIGLYFDGHRDCSCCGNRWDEAWSDDAGQVVPMILGSSPHEVRSMFGNAPAGFVHYKDGKIIAFDNI